MNALNKWSRLQLVALLLLSLFATKPAVATFPDVETDGWYAWKVSAAADAPNWCCYSWNSGVPRERICNLDSRHGGYSSNDESGGMNGELQIYALMKSGKATEIRPLSASCPAKANSAITDLGNVDVENSIDTLRPYIRGGEDLSSDALAAIAAHAGDKALSVLHDTAKSGGDLDIREEAVFWMALIRGPEVAGDLKRLMFEDRNPEFREHAAFAYSQSRIDDRFDALIELGNKDPDADVRSQAWFWLAETGAEQSEVAIRHAIAHDKSPDVREDAVFALSQLPEERAVKALAGVLEDRSLDKDIREQALFWLAQSESDEAFAYVDQLFRD